MIFRSIAGADAERVLPFLVQDPVSGLTAGRYLTRFSRREYRPEWTWIAQESHGSPPLAVAVWWGNPEGSRPGTLDALAVQESLDPAERTGVAVGLLAAAHAAYATAGAAGPPAYHIYLPAGGRDRPDVAAGLDWRERAARQAGLSATLERLRYEWTPQAGLPEPPGRLLLRPEPDDEVFADLFRQVLTGTLDAASGKEAKALGAEAQARRDVAFYREKMLGERSWWLVAETAAGELAGFGIPSRNTEVPVVGYLGVLPGHRGHRYADDILAGITRILAAEAGAMVIRAGTDLANRPMAAAFERAGYRNTARHLVLSIP
jgi:RimJ/RimL family protein N-acetyltransferase